MLQQSCRSIARPKTITTPPHTAIRPFLPRQGQEKMSKSDPNSAIFMEDSEADVKSKIKGAFCPPAQVEGNPCLAYVKHIVMPWVGHIQVLRSEEHGGDR